jgi:soluble lytic murein transglycosylase-like protein
VISYWQSTACAYLKLNLILILLITLLFLFRLPLMAAEIYRYVDANGQIHFTDIPPTKSSRPVTSSRQSHLSAVRIYKFVDNSGVIHFSDAPNDNRFRLVYEGSLFDGEASRKRGLGLHRRHGEYRDLIQDAANRFQLDAALLHAVIHTESAYNPYAVSPKGATGLMQLMAGTAKRYGVKDRTDPRDNIEGGARYLRDLLVLFKNDKRLALAGYNAGENAVIRHGNNIPPYRETRHYVDRVLSLYDIYRSVY